MNETGGCHCGAIRFSVSQSPQHVAICHCSDCRRSAGAPMVAWAAFPEAALTLTKGEPKTRNSSGAALRSFCPDCGTGLFYRNPEHLPGIVDIQSAAFDNADAFPAGIHIQTAERIGWTAEMHLLPAFERFPG